MEKNSIKEEELKKKIHEMEILIEEAKTSLSNMDDLIDQSINSNRGIWDGEEAKYFKEDYQRLSSEVPSILNSAEKQKNNIKIILDKTNIEEEK